MKRNMVVVLIAVSFALMVTGNAISQESQRVTSADAVVSPGLQDKDIIGAWLSPKLNYLWHFRSDRTFDNERGTKGVWSVEGNTLIADATNQGNNPSRYRFQLTDSGSSSSRIGL